MFNYFKIVYVYWLSLFNIDSEKKLIVHYNLNDLQLCFCFCLICLFTHKCNRLLKYIERDNTENTDFICSYWTVHTIFILEVFVKMMLNFTKDCFTWYIVNCGAIVFVDLNKLFWKCLFYCYLLFESTNITRNVSLFILQTCLPFKVATETMFARRFLK